MKNPILDLKREIISWVHHLDDLDILTQLIELKSKDKSIPLISEPQSKYAVKDDFDERFAKGMSSAEFRKRIIQHIDSLPWEK
ncbi:hypothetical protein Q73A0000_04200 [Kaistella flava (ex Peng et al. 2021)]|uniref:Uncharacterized protein n=1 Tax=Kaistella flava (ex Peng et al. 2021) TaxID=2038776 RepID=A0A7M2Y8G2_9FLAO|nr:hypothetical protein [Kaistella flava (ex Peng et al. 2021)]QOW09623.1 hypothetical protein Q73A0000_04200 [Kaistella flava (ex Peng et al. 2021)]